MDPALGPPPGGAFPGGQPPPDAAMLFGDDELSRKHGWERRTKSGRLASEIERSELEYYFHIPVDVAAQQMGVGLTKLKSICRAFNIHRWPYRRVRRLQFLAQRMNNGQGTAQDHHDIRQLMTELGLPGTSPLWRNLEVDFERLQVQLQQFEGAEQYRAPGRAPPQQQQQAADGGNDGGGAGVDDEEMDGIAALQRLATAAAGDSVSDADEDDALEGGRHPRPTASPSSSTQRPMLPAAGGASQLGPTPGGRGGLAAAGGGAGQLAAAGGGAGQLPPAQQRRGSAWGASPSDGHGGPSWDTARPALVPHPLPLNVRASAASVGDAHVAAAGAWQTLQRQQQQQQPLSNDRQQQPPRRYGSSRTPSPPPHDVPAGWRQQQQQLAARSSTTAARGPGPGGMGDAQALVAHLVNGMMLRGGGLGLAATGQQQQQLHPTPPAPAPPPPPARLRKGQGQQQYGGGFQDDAGGPIGEEEGGDEVGNGNGAGGGGGVPPRPASGAAAPPQAPTPEQRAPDSQALALQQRKESSDSVEEPANAAGDGSSPPGSAAGPGAGPSGGLAPGGYDAPSHSTALELLRRCAPELSGMTMQSLPPDLQEALNPMFMRWLLDLLGPGAAAFVQAAAQMQPPSQMR